MRRSEAHQGVRMIKFLDILGRDEASEFSQLEAAELLGLASGRSGAGRTVLSRTERRVLDRRLGKASGKRLHSEAFSRASGARSQVQLGLHSNSAGVASSFLVNRFRASD
jgi:hypothetical protein